MSAIWIVIPTYNEAANIRELIVRLFATTPEINVLVVDDASPDGTARLVTELQITYPRLKLLSRSGKLGLGSAYRAGFAYALESGAEVVGEMDADLSHAPEDVPRLVAALAPGVGAIIGSRRVPGGRVVGWGRLRKFMSWGATLFSRLVLGFKTRDVTAGFRFYTAAALARIPWRNVVSDGYAWQEEVLWLLERAGVMVVEVPIVFVDRVHGQSKLRLRQVVEFARALVRLGWQRWRGS